MKYKRLQLIFPYDFLQLLHYCSLKLDIEQNFSFKINTFRSAQLAKGNVLLQIGSREQSSLEVTGRQNNP